MRLALAPTLLPGRTFRGQASGSHRLVEIARVISDVSDHGNSRFTLKRTERFTPIKFRFYGFDPTKAQDRFLLIQATPTDKGPRAKANNALAISTAGSR